MMCATIFLVCAGRYNVNVQCNLNVHKHKTILENEWINNSLLEQLKCRQFSKDKVHKIDILIFLLNLKF